MPEMYVVSNQGGRGGCFSDVGQMARQIACSAHMIDKTGTSEAT